MKITTRTTSIRDVVIIEPEVFQDQRGFFLEAFRKDVYGEQGLPTNFVQLNHSGSVKNTVRGLHFQWEPPMGKLMRVLRGEAFLVAVDIRHGSPTLGKWVGEMVSEANRRLVWAPAGFARGFAVLSDFAEIEYLTSGTYNGACESGVLWNDPEIGIEWPVEDPILSGKDQVAQPLSQWLQRPEAKNFSYE